MLPTIPSYPLPASTQYPQPRLNWTLDCRRSALLVHDMQLYFLRPFGTDNTTVLQVVRNIAALLHAAREAGIPVFYTAQPPRQDPKDRGLLTDFWGGGLHDPDLAAIAPELAPTPGDHVLTKWRYDAFERSTFADDLRAHGRDQLVITGIYAHIGCVTTATSAFMKDIQPFMVADALADFGYEQHCNALQRTVDTCGIVTHAAQVLEDWA